MGCVIENPLAGGRALGDSLLIWQKFGVALNV